MESSKSRDLRVQYETTILDEHGDIYTDDGRVLKDVH